MGLLDRYILRLIAPGAAMGSGVFLFALLLNEIVIRLRELVTQGADPATAALALAHLVPALLAVAVPSALLFGVLFAFSRLTAGSELLAMRAGGVSSPRLLAPVGIAALLGFGATLVLMLEVVPHSNRRYLELSGELASSRLRAEIRPRVFYDELLDEKVLLIRAAPPDGDWERVFLADTSSPASPTIYVAERGRLAVLPADRIAYLELTNVESHASPDQDPGKYRIQRADRIRLPLDAVEVFGPETPGPRRDARSMRLPELVAGWEETEAPVYLVEIYKKFALPFACVAFGVIGLALGLSPTAGGTRAGGFVFAAGIVVLYYIPQLVAEELAIAGEMTPWVSVWATPAATVGIGLLLLLFGSWGMDPVGAVQRAVARLVPERFRRGPPGLAGRRSGRRPRRLLVGDRYLFRRFAAWFGASLLILLAMQLVGLVTRTVGNAFENDVAPLEFLRFLGLSLPGLALDMLPLAALSSTLVTFGVLGGSRELTAFRAAGISRSRLAVPALAGGLAVAALALGLQEGALPRIGAEAEELETRIEGRSLRAADPSERQWILTPEGTVYHYRDFDPESGHLEELSAFAPAPDQGSLRSRSFLAAAHWSESDGHWNGIGGWTRNFGGEAAIQSFARRSFPDIPPPESFLRPDLVAEQLTRGELEERIGAIEAAGHAAPALRVDFHRRGSAPAAALVTVLLGLPFAFSRANRGVLAGASFAIAIGILFLVANRLFGFLGDAGVLEAPLAAWSPNLFFGLAALFLILRPSD